MNLELIARAAWDDVKAEGDADFDSCVPEFRSQIIERAKAVANTGLTVAASHENNTHGVFGAFELAVREFLADVAPDAQPVFFAEKIDDYPVDAEIADAEPSEDGPDLAKLTRTQLDELAADAGLNPGDYANKTALIEALQK